MAESSVKWEKCVLKPRKKIVCFFTWKLNRCEWFLKQVISIIKSGGWSNLRKQPIHTGATTMNLRHQEYTACVVLLLSTIISITLGQQDFQFASEKEEEVQVSSFDLFWDLFSISFVSQSFEPNNHFKKYVCVADSVDTSRFIKKIKMFV